MQDRLSLSVEIDQDTLMGHVRFFIARYDDNHLVQNCRPYNEVLILPVMSERRNHYVWAVDVLREISAQVLTRLTQEITTATEIPMHEVDWVKEP
jgi:hypothetical protein